MKLQCLLMVLFVRACVGTEDVCSSQPCKNGGTCRVHKWSIKPFVCDCHDQYFGEFCEKVSPCVEGNPCQNGGSCIPYSYTDDGFYCQCPETHTGRRCEKRHPCLSQDNPCENGGTCVRDENEEGYKCRCVMGFVGSICEKESLCRNNPCKNGGTCRDTWWRDEQYTCNCQAGTRGMNCEYEDPCVAPPCENGGTCVSYTKPGVEGYLYRCDCTEQYTGKHCQQDSPCQKVTCYNGGSCQLLSSGVPFCHCRRGFHGDTCRYGACPLPLNECRSFSTTVRNNFRNCTTTRLIDMQKHSTCVLTRFEKILELRSCDCRPEDVARDLFEARLLDYVSYAERMCIYDIEWRAEVTSCAKESKKCAAVFYRTVLGNSALYCNESDVDQLVDCLRQFEEGQLDVRDCDLVFALSTHYLPRVKSQHTVMCTECSLAAVYNACKRKTNTGLVAACETLRSEEEMTECLESVVMSNHRCRRYYTDIMDAHKYLIQVHRQRYGRPCMELERFQQLWSEEWGCGTT